MSMDGQQKFLRTLEGLMEVPPNSLRPETDLRSIPTWDSLRSVEFVALLDKDYGLTVDYDVIAECETVEELMALVRTPEIA